MGYWDEKFGSEDIGLPGKDTILTIPQIHVHKSARTIVDRLGNVDNRLITIENSHTSSYELMEMVRLRLLHHGKQEINPVIIPITFGGFSPIELDQSVSLPLSIALRMLFSWEHARVGHSSLKSLKWQFFDFSETILPILRDSSDPVESARIAMAPHYSSRPQPTIVLIDEFPLAYRLWNGTECFAALDSATKTPTSMQMALFGLDHRDFSDVCNNGNVKVEPVKEILDIDCFDHIDLKFAALEEQIKALDCKKN